MKAERMKFKINCFIFIFSFMFFVAVSVNTAMASLPKEITKNNFCDAVNYKFLEFGWNKIICNQDRWTSVNNTAKGYPLLYQEFGFNETNNNSPVNLLLCGVHGDEPSSIYICFHLVREFLYDNPTSSNDFRLVIAPIVNPEGFFANTRQNANGVDPNRNLPTSDWDQSAHKVWSKYKKDPRKYPGLKSGSEAESRFQTYLINKYKPDKIISIHAPLGFLDFDGPGDQKLYNLIRVEQRAKYLGLNIEANSQNLLELVDFRFFPGSIGNYAGNERKIPTYTIELPSSDPSKAQDYWSVLRFALLKALRFEVYDNKEKNPFFRDESMPYHVVRSEPDLINSPEHKTTETERSAGMLSMYFKKSNHVFILTSSLLFLVSFQLLIHQRKRLIQERSQVDIKVDDSDIQRAVENVHKRSVESGRQGYLSTEECEKLINSCEPHLKPIVITALNTGMKKVELLNLKWEHINIVLGHIVLDKAKNSERMIPINNTLKKTLLSIPRHQDIPVVFYNKNTGKPYRNISNSFKKALQKSKINDFYFRDLCHTLASHLIMAGKILRK